MQDTFDLRQMSDYDVHAIVGEEVVKETIGKAQAFVAEVKRLFE